ncbi:phage regulatory protein/antirepressor Ant [Erysipelothrix urinaevulpis]|uniref:phage regulatory protein/antirepressor Ant n=1 Tax=Erysipelothrix urinaevulpis TaxID=2683717 RepID=UPI001357C49D|nr:phage regulatory protein/antirepressor Ant [Erysipelothrix urinaevulpis]
MKEIVILENKQAVTTSLMIAEVFNKRHANVIRDIEEHIKDLKESGNSKLSSEMFYEGYYVKRGKNEKKYFMNRDGFSLLVMSFNNTKGVLEWKLKYIEAFNKMEQQLQLQAPTNMIEALQMALIVAKEKEELQIELDTKNQVIGELQPKADYTDRILKSKSLVTITQIAKDYGLSGQAMNKLLNEYGVQFKQSNQWLLYRKHQAKGYTHSETTVITNSMGHEKTVMNTKWTQKGRLFLYELLKNNDVLPIIEK